MTLIQRRNNVVCPVGCTSQILVLSYLRDIVCNVIVIHCHQDQYQKWIDGGGEDTVDMAQEDDPFWEPTEDILIGSASVFLQSLAYGLDFDDKLAIADYKGDEEGTITVSVAPCTTNGQALDEDFFVDEPRDLLGKPFSFKVTAHFFYISLGKFTLNAIGSIPTSRR